MAPILSVEGVSLSFGGLRVLHRVSFEVGAGGITSVVGPNGAGKTSLFNVIGGFYRPEEGRVAFEGADVTRLASHRRANLGIGRTFQNIELFEHATVLQNLLIGRHARSGAFWPAEILFLPSVRRRELAQRRRVEEIIDFLDLQAVRDSVVAGLPYGIRKIVELARALCTEPRLLLLDEPSSGLNVEETDDMAFWIQDINKELGITVLMVEHDMNLVSRVSDRVLAINHGAVLAEGTPAEVQSHPEVVAAYLGT